MAERCVAKLCGRALSAADLDSIGTAVREADPPQRGVCARRSIGSTCRAARS